MISLTTLGAVLFNLAIQRVASPWHAAAVTLVMTLSPPILAHSFLIFPEIPALTVACAVVWVAMKPSREVTPRLVAVTAFALGLTPWIHRKFSFFVLGLLVVLMRRHAAWLRRQTPGWLAAILLAFAAPQAVLHAVTFAAWGHLGGPQMLDALPFSLSGAWVGMAGLLVDRSRGLLPYAPIYLLAPLAWWMAGRPYRDWLLPAALLYFPLAAFTTWGAGYSPAARFLVPLAPLLALPAAEVLGRPRFAWAAIPLLTMQLAISGAAWNRPRILWPDDPATNRALIRVPLVGPALNRLAPALDPGSWRN